MSEQTQDIRSRLARMIARRDFASQRFTPEEKIAYEMVENMLSDVLDGIIPDGCTFTHQDAIEWMRQGGRGNTKWVEDQVISKVSEITGIAAVKLSEIGKARVDAMLDDK